MKNRLFRSSLLVFTVFLVGPWMFEDVRAEPTSYCLAQLQMLQARMQDEACLDGRPCLSGVIGFINELHRSFLQRAYLRGTADRVNEPYEPLIQEDAVLATLGLEGVTSVQPSPVSPEIVYAQFSRFGPTLKSVADDLERLTKNLGEISNTEAIRTTDLQQLRDLRSQAAKLNAIATVVLFQNVLSYCQNFEKATGLACAKEIDRAAVVRFSTQMQGGLKPGVDRSEIYEVDKFNPLLIWKNPLVHVQVLGSKDGPQRVTLTVPVHRGIHFQSDDDWHSFFLRLKSAAETFWTGKTFSQNTKQRIELVLLLKEASDKQRVVSVSLDDPVNGWGSGVNRKGDDVVFLPLGAAKTEREIEAPQMYDSLLAHEMGHVLGFMDRYHNYIDQGTCAVGYFRDDADIMSGAVTAGPSDTQLQLLYRAYVLGQDDRKIIKASGE